MSPAITVSMRATADLEKHLLSELIVLQLHSIIFCVLHFLPQGSTIQVLHACIIGLIGCHKHWNNTESLYSQPYQYQCHPYLIKSLLRLSANCSARIILSAPNSLYHYMIIWRQVISKFDS